MKLLFILLILFTSLVAKDPKITLGGGLYTQSQPYKNCNDLVLFSPVIFYEYSIFYIRWTRVGAYFLGEKNSDYSWGASLTFEPRTYGYKAKDSSHLAGMDERKNSWEGGIALSGSYKNLWAEMMLLTDVLNQYDAWILKTEIGYDIKLGNFALYPSVLATYNSSAFENYYYGVKQNEINTNLGRNFYNPHADFQIGVQTYIKYPLTKELSTLINLKLDKLLTETTSSPLVEDTYIYSGLLSLIYTFKF